MEQDHITALDVECSYCFCDNVVSRWPSVWHGISESMRKKTLVKAKNDSMFPSFDSLPFLHNQSLIAWVLEIWLVFLICRTVFKYSYTRCQNPNENWCCLCCKDVFCSVDLMNGHLFQHYKQTNHCLAVSCRYHWNVLYVVQPQVFYFLYFSGGIY